ncbi:MAG: hypothetical protein AB7G48_14320 [Nitrospiraceae bacterium]
MTEELRGLRTESEHPQAQGFAQSSSLSPQTYEIDIEVLELHGFPYGDRDRIALALERELGRLCLEEGIPPALVHPAHIARLSGGSFTVSSGSRAERVGRQAAQAVYGAWRTAGGPSLSER